MAFLRASELDVGLKGYFQAKVKQSHRRGSNTKAEIKATWQAWSQHRGHAASQSLALGNYEVISMCELPCKCLALASAFEVFAGWKQLSIAEQEKQLEKLKDLRLWRAGEVLVAQEICQRRLLKRKFTLFEHQPSLANSKYLLDVLKAEAAQLELGSQLSKSNNDREALAVFNRALRLRPKDFSRQGRLPLETESQWAIQAGLLANAQQLQSSEILLQAEVWYRLQLALRLATMQLNLGLAAGFKRFGDFQCRESPKWALHGYGKARGAAAYIAQDFLTLAKAKSTLIGIDVGTEGIAVDVKVALAEYYSVLGCKALGRRYLSEGCSASLFLALGEPIRAWKGFQKVCQGNFSHKDLAEAHQGLGELCESSCNFERAWLEHRVALDHWAMANQQSDVENQEIRLHMLNRLIRKGRPLPNHFSSILQTLRAGRSLLQENHVIVRNVQLWDDMGGELSAPSSDCYCHDYEVLVAEALAASHQLAEARSMYEQVAHRYATCSSLNSFFAWKRLGDFCLSLQKDRAAAQVYYSQAEACLKHCSAKGCWRVEQLYECRDCLTEKLWRSLGDFFKVHNQPFAVVICKQNARNSLNCEAGKSMPSSLVLTEEWLKLQKPGMPVETLYKALSWNSDSRLNLCTGRLMHELCDILISQGRLQDAETAELRCLQRQAFSRTCLDTLRSYYS